MISVCFITKNEAQSLGPCIEHIKNFVTEFIVVDTGSTDGTPELARAMGAKVFSYEWANDFSAARNFSISKATQPWILKIDPDERIDLDHLKQLIAYTKTDFLAVRCRTRSYTKNFKDVSEGRFVPCGTDYPHHSSGYIGQRDIMYTRLFRNLPEIRYSGKIHETVEHSINTMPGGEAKITYVPSIIFHHFGLDSVVVESKGKEKFYSLLMEQELASAQDNSFVANELAQSYIAQDRFEDAARIYETAVKAEQTSPVLLTNYGYVLCQMGRRKEGEGLLMQSMKIAPDQEATYLNLGQSRLAAGDADGAQKCFEYAVQLAPQSVLAWRALGQSLTHLGHYTKAEAAFRRALAVFDGFVEAKVDLAILLNAIGRNSEAKILGEEALHIVPNDLRAKAFLESLA